MAATVSDHGRRIDTLESARDQAMGAAREGARLWGRILAAVGIIGMLGQLVIAYYTSRHGSTVIVHYNGGVGR